ncbi:MAG: hypothetical protein Q9175_007228 [Cornicularia normoerica]
MLSTSRRALTPSASEANDKDLSKLFVNTSPAALSLLVRDSSPPPFSPLKLSQQDCSVGAAQTSNGNDIMTTEQHDLPMELSSDQGSPDREQETTDDSLIGPVRADPNLDSHHEIFSLDGASDDYLQPRLEDAHAQSPLLPSAERAQSIVQSQRAQRTPTPSANNAGLAPRNSSPSQPSNNATEASREKTPRPQKAELVTSASGTASVGPEQSAPLAADEAKTSPSSKAQPPKRKHEDNLSSSEITEETTNVKKQRRQTKTEGGSTATVKQNGAVKDELPKKRGRPKKEEGSTATVKQQAATEDELPKKRGRPKKEEESAQKVTSQRASEEDTPAKRGRPKKEATPTKRHTAMQTVKNKDSDRPTKGTAATIDQDRKGREIPKERGGPGKGAEPARAAEPAAVPAVDAPKKRGRPKKGEEAAQDTQPQIAPTADTPRKRGRPKKNGDIAEAAGSRGLSIVETPKKRGRPLAAELGETPKTLTPGKRGRPKKEQAMPKGAKPVGIVKKKAGRK